MIDQRTKERFWSKVKKGNPYECWEWQAYRNRGYGTLSRKRGQSPHKAHRLSWMIHYGAIKQGMNICHKCDNPGCVNPRHLFMGTQRDNITDAIKKKRIGNNKNSLGNLRPGKKGVRGAGPKSNRELQGEI